MYDMVCSNNDGCGFVFRCGTRVYCMVDVWWGGWGGGVGGFFFKQKTAYEIQYGLVGSEMCIRDRSYTARIGITDTLPVGLVVIEESITPTAKTVENNLIMWEVDVKFGEHRAFTYTAVSYTHLTLPTSDLVQISVVAVSLKKKLEKKKHDATHITQQKYKI